MSARIGSKARRGGPTKSTPPAKRSGAPRLDAANLAGITSLMNTQNVRQGVDLGAAEKSIMGKTAGTTKTVESDPVKIYTKELNQLAEELGIDLMDDKDDGVGVSRPAARELARPHAHVETKRPVGAVGPRKMEPIIDDLGDLDLLAEPRHDREPHRSERRHESREPHRGERRDERRDPPRRDPPRREPHRDERREPPRRPPPDDDGGSEYTDATGSEYTDDGEGDEYTDATGSEYTDDGEGDEYTDGEDDDIDHEGVISKLEKDLGIDTDPDRDRKRRKMRPPVEGESSAAPRHKSSLTEEQEKRRHINSVIGDMRQETRTSFGAERERVQDLKANKLEQIGQLRMALEEEGIDTKAVGAPTPESSMEEIDSVLNILRLKNDRNRYSSLADEVLIGAAEGIESVFDGTRSVPVLGWRPDYTGYAGTISVKLHRMRFETSQIVGNIIEKYNIGPSARVIMELLPSFFLYPRQQKKQRGAPGLHNDPRIVGNAGTAMNAIRESDERQGIDTLARI